MSLNQTTFWFNADGLFVPFGRSIGARAVVGEFENDGEMREVQAVIPLASLAPAGEFILSDTVRFPKGALFEEVEAYVRVGAAGGTSVSLGFILPDRTTHDASGVQAGLINGLLTAEAPAGAIVKFRGATSVPAGIAARAGTLITTPTPLASTVLLTATTVGTFTNGLLYVKIRYKPEPGATQSGN